MKDNNWTEKRQDVRAMVSLRAKVKIIEPEKAEEIKTMLSSCSPQEKSITNEDTMAVAGTPIPCASEYLDLMERKSDPMFSFIVDSLGVIDEKLEKILDIIENKNGQAGKEVEKTVDISGSGMSLVMNSPVKNGQILSISLQIPGFNLGKFEIYGEVVRSRVHKNENRDCVDVGVKFLNLSDEQREFLIAYTFCQNRKTIRKNKDSSSKIN